jgi:hypothetical protein
MAGTITERIGDISNRAQSRLMESRLDKTERENDRLKGEVHLLRDDIQEERSALQRALDALKRDDPVVIQADAPTRRGRLIGTIVVIGGAYLLGARAGRERYDDIVQRMGRMKEAIRARATEELEHRKTALQNGREPAKV